MFTINELEHKVDEVVWYILTKWSTIQNDYNKMVTNGKNEDIDTQTAKKDGEISKELYHKFKKHGNIKWEEKLWQNTSSVVLEDIKRNIRVEFPQCCRKWIQSSFYSNIVSLIKNCNDFVTLNTFLCLYKTIENSDIAIKTTKSDRLILRSIIKASLKAPGYHLLTSKNIARLYRKNIIHIKKRTDRLIKLGVLDVSLNINLAKIGFKTIITEKDLGNENKRFQIAKLDLQAKKYYIYKVPPSYNLNKQAMQLENFEFGFNIDTFKSTSLPVGLDTYYLHSTKTVAKETPKNGINHILKLKPEQILLNEDEFEIIRKLSPKIPLYLENFSKEVSKTSLNTRELKILRNLMKKDLFYYFVTIKYMGFPVELLIYVNGDINEINNIKNKLRYVFNYHFFSDANQLFAHIQIAKNQVIDIFQTLEDLTEKCEYNCSYIVDGKNSFWNPIINLNNIDSEFLEIKLL